FGLQAHRYPREQRRHFRAEQADLGISGEGLEPGDRDQPYRAVSLLPRRRAVDDQTEIWTDRECCVGRGKRRQPERPRLFRLEGRTDRAHEIARQGACAIRYRRELCDACGGKSRATVLSRSRRSPRPSPSPPHPIARSQPARCSIFRAAAQLTERTHEKKNRGEAARAPRGGRFARAARRYRADVLRACLLLHARYHRKMAEWPYPYP